MKHDLHRFLASKGFQNMRFFVLVAIFLAWIFTQVFGLISIVS